jgi:hypothetical protein
MIEAKIFDTILRSILDSKLVKPFTRNLHLNDK